MITMNIASHIYTHALYGKYDSVSKLKSSVVPPFDKDYWLPYKALERLIPDFKLHLGNAKKPKLDKYIGWVTTGEFEAMKQTIEIEWAAKALVGQSRGTNFHDMKEARAKRDLFTICPYDGKKYLIKDPHELTEESKRSLLTSIIDLEVGCCYPEIMIWNDAYKYAGTVDKLFVTGPNRIFFLDYKTDKQFRIDNRWSKLLHPVNYLDECELNIYGIQLGLYSLPFHQLDWEIVGCELLHNFMGNEKSYPVPVMLKEAILVANSFANNRDLN